MGGGFGKIFFFLFLQVKEFIQILFLPTLDQPIGASITGKVTEGTVPNSHSDRGK